MINTNFLEEKVLIHIKEKLKEIIYLNNFLSDNPEISGKEYKSMEKISLFLEEEGFEVNRGFLNIETSFIGKKENKNLSKKIAILVEYDALPDVGHACGHCVSGSISLLAGIALSKIQEDLGIEVHLIGTPKEETEGSKVNMVKAGIFNDYSMAIMIHLYDKNIIRPTALALDSMEYIFHGKAAHAASAPWEGKNAFNGVQLMFHGIDMLRQHVKTDVRIHGILKQVGEAPNIVPNLCSAEIYIRAKEREYLNEVGKLVDNCAEGASISTGTTWEKKYTANSFDNIISNKTGERILENIYKELGLEIYEGEDLFGSTDAGNISRICPTFHSTLQLVPPEVAIHSQEFAKYSKGKEANKAIYIGSRIICMQAIRIFGNEDLYNEMLKEFMNKNKI